MIWMAATRRMTEVSNRIAYGAGWGVVPSQEPEEDLTASANVAHTDGEEPTPLRSRTESVIVEHVGGDIVAGASQLLHTAPVDLVATESWHVFHDEDGRANHLHVLDEAGQKTVVLVGTASPLKIYRRPGFAWRSTHNYGYVGLEQL
ncbi:MAG TPA: hypothetical protein VFK04_15560 [Gemmatimonadaceae bacterium]|nr:hypothetical protein [Gemmatimonadaceae bacterium]